MLYIIKQSRIICIFLIFQIWKICRFGNFTLTCLTWTSNNEYCLFYLPWVIYFDFRHLHNNVWSCVSLWMHSKMAWKQICTMFVVYRNWSKLKPTLIWNSLYWKAQRILSLSTCTLTINLNREPVPMKNPAGLIMRLIRASGPKAYEKWLPDKNKNK